MTTFLIFFTMCLTACILLACVAAPLVERAKPSAVVPLLAAGSLLSSASMGIVLTMLAVAVLGRMQSVASVAGWSAEQLEVNVPVPTLIGVIATVLVATLLARATCRTARILFLLIKSNRLPTKRAPPAIRGTSLASALRANVP